MLIDYMHQVLLCVVKTLLCRINGSRKILGRNKTQVSAKLLKCKLPGTDNKRQLRSLETLKYWKATELKLFLLYGFVSFFGVLSVPMFVHFYLLSTAIRYLIEPVREQSYDKAEVLIKIFRKLVPYFYGEAAQTYNMHSLGHLADQAKKTGPLASLSSIPFESAHFHLKRAIGPNTSAIVATKLAVKRHQRRFFRKKLKGNSKTVTVGSLKLLQPTERVIEVNGNLETLMSSKTFELDSKMYACHGSKCTWNINKTCVHFVEYEKEGATGFGQLTDIFVDVSEKSAAVHLVDFDSSKTFTGFLIQKLENHSSPTEHSRVAVNLDEGLELISSCYENHHLIQCANSDITLVDVKKLLSPCIVREIDGRLILSTLCVTFERD